MLPVFIVTVKARDAGKRHSEGQRGNWGEPEGALFGQVAAQFVPAPKKVRQRLLTYVTDIGFRHGWI